MIIMQKQSADETEQLQYSNAINAATVIAFKS